MPIGAFKLNSIGRYLAPTGVNSAVTFDGTGDYYSASVTSSGAASTKFVVALTYKTDTTAGQTHMINMYSTSSSTYGFYIWINGGRSQLVITQGTTGSEVYNVYTGTSTVTTTDWEQIVWYFDMATFANCKCYKNGVSQSLTQASFNGTLSLNFNSISTIKIGQENTAQTATGNDYDGAISQVYVNGNLSAEPNIALFWDSAQSKPEDLGTNGTGSGLPQPYVYHYGTTSTFATNRGTGMASYTLTAAGNVADTIGPTYATAARTTANTITANGNAQISTTQSKFGGSSALFDGTTDYLSMPSIAYPGVSTFTVEGYFYLTNVTSRPTVGIWQNEIGDSNRRHQIFFTTSTHPSVPNRIYIGFGVGSPFDFPYVSYTLTANTWFHFAVSRDSSNNIRFFINGTQQGATQTSSREFFPTVTSLTARIGSNSYDNADLYGYVDEFRISNVARYTANFTAPTTPFVNDSNTLLLIHADGDNNSTTFVDDAGTGQGRSRKVITANGNAQIDTAQSKFGGSSVLFDGTGDYLSAVDSSDWDLGTMSQWTVEMWFRPAVIGTAWRGLIGQQNPSGSTIGWGMYLTTAGNIGFLPASTTTYTSSNTLSANTWYHIAAVRNGSNFNLYIDGTSRYSTSSYTDRTNSSEILTIGAARDVSSGYQGYLYTNGHLDEIRISNTARYTANFTAPTAPFVTDSNTLLLIHGDGTDAATTFYDDNHTATFRTDAYAEYLKLALPFDKVFRTVDVAHRITGTGLTATATQTRGANVTMGTTNVKWTSPQYLYTADFAPGGDALVYTLPTSIPSSASGTYVIEGWFRAEATGTKWCISSADSGGRYLFSVSSDTTAFSTSEGNQNFVKIGTSLTHIAIVCDAGTKRLYQDGIYKGAWLTGNTGFTNLHLGQFNSGDANDYDGQIQDFRVYIGTNKGYTGTNASVANFTLPSSIIESY